MGRLLKEYHLPKSPFCVFCCNHMGNWKLARRPWKESCERTGPDIESTAIMEIFVMVRREKTTIFLDCKEATTVYELKKMVEGITKKAPDDQRLYKDDQILDDSKTLEDCGFTTQTAKAQSPALISLSFRGEDGEFEPVVIAPLSTPPELPDVMKPQESVSNSDGS